MKVARSKRRKPRWRDEEMEEPRRTTFWMEGCGGGEEMEAEWIMVEKTG